MPRKNLLSLHEAIVVALINKPSRTASFNEIANFIEKRNLYTERKGNITLATQVMLRSTQAKGAYRHLFEDIGAGYIRLKDTINPLKLYNDLEALLKYDKQFYSPDAKLLSVVSNSLESKETIKLKISPANIICIVSKDKSRVKNIYVSSDSSAKRDTATRYQFNNNEYNFHTLCEYLDPVSNYLTVISKSVIVNVAFFDLISKQKLNLNRQDLKIDMPLPIKISGKSDNSGFIQKFRIIQEAYKRRILLQKTAIGYKTDMRL